MWEGTNHTPANSINCKDTNLFVTWRKRNERIYRQRTQDRKLIVLR
jgi:hypothetical protein